MSVPLAIKVTQSIPVTGFTLEEFKW